MRNSVRIAISVLAALCIHGKAVAGSTSCSTTTSGTPYCSYTGKVVQAYVNDSNLVILYLDTNFTQTQLTAVGITGVTNLSSVARQISTDPEFSKMLYATMLAAKVSDSTVTVQMKGVYNGYLEIDKIWLK